MWDFLIRVKCLPDKRILAMSKLKAFADNSKLAQMVQFFFNRVENIEDICFFFFFLVKDGNLFHLVDTIGNIFMIVQPQVKILPMVST